MQIRFAALLLACLFAGLFALTADVPTEAATTLPTKMNFQGRITNAAGNILANGTYNMRFKIWNAATSGTQQWSEDRLVSATQGVTVTNGQFSVQLGSVTSLPASIFASNSLYFEVELPTPASATTSSPVWTEGPMTPRNQLATSAYAYNAETLDGIDSAAFAQVGTGNTFTGANTFSGTSGFTNTLDVNVSNANALRVRNGATNLFNADTTSSIVSIGTSDTTGAVLVLDTKTGAGDPTGGSATNGAMYYNSNANKFRCYQNGAWADCITPPGSVSSGTTAGRPGAPAEGNQYYDTDVDRLLVYANGKWQADRSDSILVASSTSSQADRDAADYVTDGNTAAANDGDQVQINAALTAATGRKVVLLAGTYTIDASVVVPNKTTLSGVGLGTLIQLATINATDNMIESAGDGQVIQDLRIDGGTNSAGTQNGISITGNINVRIKGVTVQNMRSTGLYTTTSTNVTITESSFIDNNDRGLYFDSFTENIIFQNNIVRLNDVAGLLTFGVKGMTISGNIFDNNPTDAIVLNTSSSVTIANNSVTDNSWGMAIVGSSDVSVDGNAISDNTAGDAIHLTNSNRISVTDNRLHNNGAATAGSGIKISNSDDAYITGNSITDTAGTGYAIDIDVSTSDNAYLSNNVYSGTGAASINDAGTGTRYGGQLNGSTNYVIQPAGTIELMKNTNVTGTLSVSTTVNAVSGYRFNGTSGSTTTCTGGQVLQNQVVQGGIVTGGTCTAPGGTPTLQNVYDNSSSPATITTTAGKGLLFTSGANVPTADQLVIDNTGSSGVATSGVNGMNIKFKGGAGAIEASGARIDLTPGTTSASTWNGLKIVAAATGAASGVTEYGLNVDGPTSQGAGNEVGISIDANWDAALQLGSKSGEPGLPAADSIYVYASKYAGRSLLSQKGPNGVSFAYQPALFQNTVTQYSPNTTTTGNYIGGAWTIDTTASTATNSTETLGFGTNFATAATANDTSGTYQTATQFLRGSVSGGANGYFAVNRLVIPDSGGYGSGATGARIWSGMTNQTAATMTLNDNPAGHYSGFQYSTNRGDTTWRFMTKDGTTQNVINTGLTFTPNKVYDLYTYVPPLGSTIYWRIDNLNDGTTQEGSTTSNLPGATTNVRAAVGIATLTTTARNIRVNKFYVESDR